MENLPAQIEQPEEIPGELFYNSEEVKEYAKDDMDFFAGLVCPEDLVFAFPAFYVYLWTIVTQAFFKARDFSKFALGLPRGHGKTMVVKLLIVYAILFSKKRYILVIGANVKKAQAIIADVADMLDSANVQTVFGNWRYDMETDTQDLKKFTFNGRSIILEAAGQGTSIRGSQQKNARPDLMVFDDAQTKDCAESIIEADNFRRWFIGTALKAKSQMGCTFIYIGNMYKDLEVASGSGIYTCMLRNLQKSPSWTSFIVGAILEDFTALWEELVPLEQLLEEYRGDLEIGEADIFFAEVLNDPQATTSFYFDSSKVTQRVRNSEDVHQGSYIVIDPATSKATPDQICVGYFEVFDGTPNAAEIHQGKWTSPKLVHFVIDLALRKNCSLLCVESNAYQYSLCEWLHFVLGKMGIHGMHIVEVYNTSTSKNSRILRVLKSLMNGEITTSSQSHAQIISQGSAFNPKIITNVDDILDTLQMAQPIPKRYPHLLDISGDLYREQSLLGPSQSESPAPSSF